jgi:hypothetical protein
MPNEVQPRVVLVIRQDGSMNTSCCRGIGGSEGRRNKMVDVHNMIGICADNGIVDRRVHWWDESKNKVSMSMEECCL